MPLLDICFDMLLMIVTDIYLIQLMLVLVDDSKGLQAVVELRVLGPITPSTTTCYP